MKDRIVFEWDGQWYAVDNDFKKSKQEYIMLPSGRLLKHSGRYETLVLLSYADYAKCFTEITYDKSKLTEEIIRNYNAAIAEEIEEQILAGGEDEWYNEGGYLW